MFLDSSKGLAVEVADAEFFNRPLMFSGSIAFVFGKIILRVHEVTLRHHLVPGDFGYDGSGRNGVAEPIAFSDGFLRNGDFKATLGAVDQDKIGRGGFRWPGPWLLAWPGEY